MIPMGSVAQPLKDGIQTCGRNSNSQIHTIHALAWRSQWLSPLDRSHYALAKPPQARGITFALNRGVVSKPKWASPKEASQSGSWILPPCLLAPKVLGGLFLAAILLSNPGVRCMAKVPTKAGNTLLAQSSPAHPSPEGPGTATSKE